MRKIISIMVLACMAFCVSAQTHIKFNGASFGQTLENFISGFPEKPYVTKSYDTDVFNADICNGSEAYIKLNSETWKCFIFSSRTSNIVFRTISVNGWPQDLRGHLMLLVKALEEKYGGHYEEPQSELGYIKHSSSKYKEMLALKYQVKNSNNQVIGEIRISAAPWNNGTGDGGCVELSYTDLVASKQATKEYSSIMKDAL